MPKYDNVATMLNEPGYSYGNFEIGEKCICFYSTPEKFPEDWRNDLSGRFTAALQDAGLRNFSVEEDKGQVRVSLHDLPKEKREDVSDTIVRGIRKAFDNVASTFDTSSDVTTTTRRTGS